MHRNDLYRNDRFPFRHHQQYHSPMSFYSYFEKGCRIKCTRQPRKVLWVVLSSLFFKEIKVGLTATVLELCIDHIAYYLLGLSRAHFFRQSFSKQLYTVEPPCSER